MTNPSFKDYCASQKPIVDKYKYHDYGEEDGATDCRLCGGVLVVITLIGSMVYAFMRWYV